MKKPRFNLTGKRFGRLTVIEWIADPLPSKQVLHKGTWACVCDCGKTIYQSTNHLTSGHSESCGCLHDERLTDYNRKNGFLKNKGVRTVEKIVLTMYKRNSKKDNRVFLLSDEEALSIMRNPCSYCGDIDLRTNPYSKESFLLNGIDRVDSSKGYEIGNVVPCCKKCNIAKHNYSKEDFLLMVKKIYEYSNLGEN